jgi:hypothetical protein
MATKKKRGEVLDLTTRILIEIRDEVRGTNERVDALATRVDTGFAQINARLENLIDIAGDRYRDLDARVRALEARAH